MAYVYYSQPAQPVSHPLQHSQTYASTPVSEPPHHQQQFYEPGPPVLDQAIHQHQPVSQPQPLPYPSQYYAITPYAPERTYQQPAYPQYRHPEPPVAPAYVDHYRPQSASLSSRPLPRPLPQAPVHPLYAQDTSPPPVPDHSSRPPARYMPVVSSPAPVASTSRPLPPDPSLSHHARPLPPTRQPRRSSGKEAPVPVPSIAIEPEAEQLENKEEGKGEEAPTVPSFSFSGPEEDDDEPQPSKAPEQKRDQQPGFSVKVAPPSPPKMKAVSTSSRVNELGQSQKSNKGKDEDSLSDSITTLSLSQEMVCAGCSMPIGGRIVSAMKRRWHPDCFKCEACGEGLEHVAFYEAEGKPYCHVDYHEKFSIRCYHCKTPIESETYVTLDDPTLGHRYYHELHFFCSECGDPFIDPKSLNRRAGEDGDQAVLAKPFVVQAGWPYCEACNVRLHKPKCAGCKQPIQDEEVLGALGKQWHEICFVCHSCKEPFEDSFMLREGDPYCEPCYRVALRSDV